MVEAVRIPRLPSRFQSCNEGLGLEIHIFLRLQGSSACPSSLCGRRPEAEQVGGGRVIWEGRRPLNALPTPGFSLCVPLRVGVRQEGPETLYSPHSLPLSSTPSAPLPSAPPLGLLPGLAMMRESSEPSSLEEPETSQQLLNAS